MSPLRMKTLPSRLGKRAFWLLGLLVTVPVLAVTLLALSNLTHEVLAKEREHLHRFGKGFLLSAYAALQHHERTLIRLTERHSEIEPSDLSRLLSASFDRYAVSGAGFSFAEGIDENGAIAVLELDNERVDARTHVFARTVAARSEIWMKVRTDSGLQVAAMMEPASLWGESDGLPQDVELCVVNANGLRVHCPHQYTQEIIDQTIAQASRNSTAHTTWPGPRGESIGNYWTLFLRSGFAGANWIVMTRIAEQDVFSPIRKFQRYFVPLIVAVTILSMLILLVQLRRNLAPLESLVAGTKRIARRDFSARIDLDGHDEFSEVARSFNTMSSHLDRMFGALEVSAEIDSTILRTFDMGKVVDLFLTRVFEVFQCETSVVILSDGEAGGAQIHSCTKGAAPAITTVDTDFDLATITGVTWFDRQRDPPLVVRLVQQAIAHSFSGVCVPIVVGDRIEGLLMLDVVDDRRDDGAVTAVLKDWAQRLSVAKAADEWEARLNYLALHDYLTGLPNRPSFQDYLRTRIDDVEGLGLLFLDLDHFKNINDTRGHSTGDRLLQLASTRLQEVIKSDGKVFRLGGDEFTIVIDFVDRRRIRQMVERVLEFMRSPFVIDGREFFVTVSIGVSLYPDNGHNVDTLVKNADLAMYYAKRDGRNKVAFFNSGMMAATYYRTVLEADLRKAVRQHQFFVNYQPQINIRDHNVACVEALVRWRHPEQGVVAPGIFMSAAEDIGLVDEIDKWVLKTACEHFHHWSGHHMGIDGVAVNVSPKTLLKPEYLPYLGDIVDRYSMRGMLELEITENVFLEQTEQVFAVMRRIKALGISIALDDFGSGYSSMSYLHRLPIDTLKIDISFIRGIDEEKSTKSIVQAIMQIARTLSLNVVAEGVESDEELAFLKSEGCDLVQGYYYSEPIDAEKVIEYMENLRSDHPDRIGISGR